MFDSLSSLDTSRTTWRIKVRLTRMWPSLSSSKEGRDALKGYNLILLDDDNFHVHGFVYADNWRSISDKMVEGGLYVITNFYTREAKGTLKPTSSNYLINFSNSTTVEKVLEDDFMIPSHNFEFVDLSELFKLASSYENADSPEFSTDIIGVLEDFENVRPIQTMFGEKNIVKFRITDGRYSHKVTVWGQLAITTDEMYEKNNERPIIVIVASSKLKIFKSSVQINTLPSSKIYLNLDNEYVTAMKLRLEEEGYKISENTLSSPTQTTPTHVIESITLKELCEKNQSDDLDKNFTCFVKVSNVEEVGKWWYLRCIKCQEDAIKLDGGFKCSKCTLIMPVPQKRFKIVVLAGDATEAFNFVLLDKAVRRIVGVTVTKIISDNPEYETSNNYPTKLKEIAGKEFTFNIQITEDNVRLQSNIFKVTDAYDTNFSISSPLDTKMKSLTESSFSENIIDLSNSLQTPGSATSCSKKIKTEK